jgi:hypothetical protein
MSTYKKNAARLLENKRLMRLVVSANYTPMTVSYLHASSAGFGLAGPDEMPFLVDKRVLLLLLPHVEFSRLLLGRSSVSYHMA